MRVVDSLGGESLQATDLLYGAMHFDLLLSGDWNAKATPRELAKADESGLRYEVLLGDLILEANGVDFSAQWGWIPLLDLGSGIKDMCDDILTGEPEATFEFTESDAWLRFSRRGDRVEISASYVPQKTIVEMRDLCALVTSTAQGFFTRVATQNPGLALNPSFDRMRERVFGKPVPKRASGNAWGTS